MNYIDGKVTLWQRLHFDDRAYMQGVAGIIKESGLKEAMDSKIGFTNVEPIYESEELLQPDEYDQQPTIKVFEDGNLIWDNVKK